MEKALEILNQSLIDLVYYDYPYTDRHKDSLFQADYLLSYWVVTRLQKRMK